MQLRDYQRAALDDLYHWLRTNDGNPCLVLPTGAGKSVVIAELCREAVTNWPETKVLMLTHVKELIEQNAAKMRAMWPNAPLGIYSAGLRRKELGEAITFGGIQSLRGRADEIGHIDLCVIDECHLVSHKDEGGYRDLLAELSKINPCLRVIGLTATPWRLGHGLITDKPAIFDGLLEPVSIEELIHRGFLTPLRSKMTDERFDLSKVAKRGGEYVESDLAAAVDTADQNERVADEIIARAGDRKAWLLFCAGVEHAKHMCSVLLKRGVLTACVTGDTPTEERAQILHEYRRGRLRCVTNANVLTTGFDYPNIDLIAMLRPTLSPSLYMQMAGRGLRLKEHTDHCLVLDFAGNVETHGPVTCVRTPKKSGDKKGDAPTKVCDSCGEIAPVSARECPACGSPFPALEAPVQRLRNDDIMGEDTRKTRPVLDWRVRKHAKPGKPEMLRIDYALDDTKDRVSEYLCLRHGGYAQLKSERTLVAIGDAVGLSLDSSMPLDALANLLDSAQAPTEITYDKQGEFFRVKIRKFAPPKPGGQREESEDPVPF